MTAIIKILLIEDNQDHIDLIKVLNEDFKFDLIIGHDLKDFQNIISENKEFKLILCDIDLSYPLEGLDILEFFKLTGLKAAIYAYTLSSNNEKFFLERGFKGVIKKSIEELKELFTELAQKYSIFQESENILI